MELIRDHTYGEMVGEPTPASMIADNDAATGLFVQAVSQSKYWNSTAIFIVEDDPQIGYDHIDYHRTICVVASPWVKPSYVSHTQAAFPSLFRTFELMLGIPSMNRFDTYAMPLRDLFASTLNPSSQYMSTPSAVPVTYVQPGDSLESLATSQMDFGGADRNPLLGEVVWKSLTGEFPRNSRIVEMAKRGRHNFRLPEPDDR
jgi:hypothetical protein